ncbi:MAG TPA: Ig-like domain-containing protein [Actinospica sp.]|nr:Ig-like domain-containing protein [Actinospica sp.]
MSRMFHRVLATSVIGAAALTAPAAAMAADSGGGGGSGAEPVPTAVVVHLPKHVEAGQPVTVTARVSIPQAAAGQGGAQDGKGADKPGHDSGKKHKGAGHGKKGKKHHKGSTKRRHKVTGKVEFFLDGKAEPPVELNHGRASEQIDIPVGKHTLVAQYSGDDEHLASKSNPVSFELTAGDEDQSTAAGTGAPADAQNPDADYPTLGQDSQDPTFDQGWDDGQDEQGPSQDDPNMNGDEDQI